MVGQRRGGDRPRARPEPRLSADQLRALAVDCMLDSGCCEEPDLCQHPANRMTPLEFAEWVARQLSPPPRPRPALSTAGREEIIAGQARRRARERRQLAHSAA